ncbi:heme A synthase [Pseudomonas sp. v388]|uniref:COX15/CtaA family protein n=1 Tax=Pseudomonas sp. v388 TaxID=2479849 RepID=UPI000F7AE0C5|nr:COX15/CtaA family protein [Pseudomonas sp. v388]RRV09209.1 heme A synthase [Pseudomonas sp. v388]
MTRPGFRLALLATLLALVVVLLGAYTRLTHAGLGCPDWPGCYGFIAVPSNDVQLAHAQLHFPHAPVEADKGWSEMIHRYFAGALALTILLLAVQAWRTRHLADQPLKLPLLILAVVVAQAAFGMWTVTLQLWPPVVVTHLLGGFATLSLLLVLTLRLAGIASIRLSYPAPLRRLARFGLLLVVTQIALGGWVSANYAAMACTDLPTCQGQWWPDADFTNAFHVHQHIGPNYLGGRLDSEARTAIHLTHRIGALLVVSTLSMLAWHLLRAGLGKLAATLMLVLFAQLGLGLSNVLLHLPLGIALAHNAGGAALLLSLVSINYRLAHSTAQPAAHDPFNGLRFGGLTRRMR